MRALPFKWIPRGEPFHQSGSGSPGAFPPILEHLIRQRGLPAGADLEGFLRPRLRDLADPFLIPDMALAVERILLAVDRKEKICIYGDYDVDGVTSITLMRQILRAYGLEPPRITAAFHCWPIFYAKATRPSPSATRECDRSALAESASPAAPYPVPAVLRKRPEGADGEAQG